MFGSHFMYAESKRLEHTIFICVTRLCPLQKTRYSHCLPLFFLLFDGIFSHVAFIYIQQYCLTLFWQTTLWLALSLSLAWSLSDEWNALKSWILLSWNNTNVSNACWIQINQRIIIVFKLNSTKWIWYFRIKNQSLQRKYGKYCVFSNQLIDK